MKKNYVQPKVSEFLREAEREIAASTEDISIEIPKQPEFFKTPVRFGSIPVDDLPMGCDAKEQYRRLFPPISLPFQQVEKISFGHPELQPNRLIFGDNLHVMRMLPSNSIDLIYLDPPFFSGRNYNVVFGDQNEVRSFTDIWEGGMPGYLAWLNARLLEMKRLLKPTGSIYVHCDWHASHYIKIELDKIFGYDNFRNEITWKRSDAHSDAKQGAKHFGRVTDSILFYTKSDKFVFNTIYEPLSVSTREKWYRHIEPKTGRRYNLDNLTAAKAGGDTLYSFQGITPPQGRYWAYSKEKMQKMWDMGRIVKTKTDKLYYKRYLDESKGVPLQNLWLNISMLRGFGDKEERLGYPTQKPETLLNQIMKVSSNPGDIIGDFFCGGGTTPGAAQKLGRRWIACDISRIAVSVTRDRLLRLIMKGDDGGEIQHSLAKVPDISIEHWGIYEVPKLVELSNESFRNFVVSAFNGNSSTTGGLIHGYKNGIPIFVGPSSQDKAITKEEVAAFAKEITTKKDKRHGIMIAWAFAPSAQEAVQKLAASHTASIEFIKLELIPLEAEKFREHITSRHPEYRSLLKFILPPEVRVSTKHLKSLEHEFDVSESVSLNPGGKIVNVQWDFKYDGKRFISTRGYSFIGMQNNKPVLKVTYKFDSMGKRQIACKVQDDEGGERIHVFELNVQ